MKLVEVLEAGYVKGSSQKGDKIDVSHLSDAEIEALVTAKKAKVLTVTSDEKGDSAKVAKLETALKAEQDAKAKLEKELADLKAKAK